MSWRSPPTPSAKGGGPKPGPAVSAADSDRSADEQQAIAEMHRLAGRGASLRQIRAALAGQGVDIAHTTVAAILRRGSEWPGAAPPEAAD
jgi:hypothetical protein